ncbi:Ras-GAP domain-containing protein [Entamoeba marina]
MSKKEKKDTNVEDGAPITYSSEFTQNLSNGYLCFISLLTKDLELARVFGECLPIGSQDQFSNTIVEVMSKVHVIEDFISLLLRQEFTTNILTSTLFRANSLCTKVQTAYARKECQLFMMKVFLPIVQKIIAMPPCELDPIKLQDLNPSFTAEQIAEKQSENLVILQNLCDELIATLRRHLRETPISLAVMCHQIRESCFLYHTDDPTVAFTLIGGFVFLRLFCPSLAAPEGMNLCGTALVPPPARRTLILLTKILQNIANNARETKEPWMTASLPYVISRGPVLQAYLRALVALATRPPPRAVVIDPSSLDPILMIELHRLLDEAKPQLQQRLEKSTQLLSRRVPWSPNLRKPSTRVETPPDPQGLLKITDLLGPSPKNFFQKVPKFSPNAPTGNLYRDFLSDQLVVTYVGRSPKQESVWYIACERIAQGMIERGFLTGFTRTTEPFITEDEVMICDMAWVTMNQADAIVSFIKKIGTGKVVIVNAQPSIKKQLLTSLPTAVMSDQAEIKKAYGELPKTNESRIFDSREVSVIQRDKKTEKILRIGYSAIYIINPKKRKISDKYTPTEIGEYIGYSKSGLFQLNGTFGQRFFSLKTAVDRGLLMSEIYSCRMLRSSLFQFVKEFEFSGSLVGRKGEKEVDINIYVTPVGLILLNNKFIDREICFCAIDTVNWVVIAEKQGSREVIEIECRSIKKDEIIADFVRISVTKGSIEDFKTIMNSVLNSIRV